MSTTDQLIRELARSKRFRAEFVKSHTKRLLPLQIQELMEQQGLNQTKLAELSGLSQATISRATDPEYGNMNINTCVDIADGCDVAFIGFFLSYSRFVELLNQEGDNLTIPKFSDEFSEDGTRIARKPATDMRSANEVQLKMAKTADSVEIKTSDTGTAVSPKTKAANIEFDDLQTATA